MTLSKKMKKKMVENVEKNKILWILDIENNICGLKCLTTNICKIICPSCDFLLRPPSEPFYSSSDYLI